MEGKCKCKAGRQIEVKLREFTWTKMELRDGALCRRGNLYERDAQRESKPEENGRHWVPRLLCTVSSES